MKKYVDAQGVMAISNDSYGMMMVILILSASLLLSSCDLISGEATRQVSERMSFRCRGSTNIMLADYCRSVSDESVKLLIMNRHLSEVRGVSVEVNYLSDSQTFSESSSLDIDESKVFEIPYSPYPRFDDIVIIPQFLTSRGLETCDPITLNFSDIRECHEAEDIDDASEDTI